MAIFVGEGDSSFCQLPSISEPLSPQHDDDSKILQISCGTAVAVALVGVKGRPTRLLEWGTGLYGERLSSPEPQTEKEATGERQYRTTELQPLQLPTEVFTLPPRLSVRSIACGAHFVLAAAESGGCIAWGGGRDPRSLGRGGCGSCISLACTAAAAPGIPRPSSGMPDWVDKPLGAGGLKVASLAAGDDHAVAVCANGTTWAWGRGDCGQLGCGAPLEDAGAGGASHGSCVPTTVGIPGSLRPSATSAVGDRERPALALAAACGRDHSAVLTKGGHLWTFGSGLHGQLGLGTVGERAWTPLHVRTLEGVGEMQIDGSFTGIASVACGAWHTAAVSTTGDVYTWGWARFGALGPSPPDEPRPQNRGAVVAKQSSGGGNDARKTASNTDEGAEVRPYPGLVDGLDDLLSEGDEIVSVGCGARYTLALTRKRRAFVWGQVAPSADGGGGGSFRRSSSDTPRASFACPRELKPAELLRAAPAAEPTGGDDTNQRCSNRGGGDSSEEPAREGNASRSEETRWKVSAAGCGPWYVVLGLEGQTGLGGAVCGSSGV